MDDLAGMITELLKDPQALEQIKGLTGLLGQTNPPIEQKPKPQFDSSLMPPDTMQTVMKLMPILSCINKEDETTKFLNALRPLLGNKRRNKLDEAGKMIQMMKIIPILKNQGML